MASMGSELTRLGFYLAYEPTLTAYVRTRTSKRHEWTEVSTGVAIDLDKVGGYVVTYPSGEIVDHFRMRGRPPEGAHFMEGPTYQDDSSKYKKSLVDNKMVSMAHGPCLSRPDEAEYYSTTITNLSDVRIRILKFVGLWKTFGLFAPRDDGSGYYSPRHFIEWFRVSDKEGWIAPSESVTDPENWGAGAGIWAYFLEKEGGGQFIGTIPLPKY